jgi:hypothetical protein
MGLLDVTEQIRNVRRMFKKAVISPAHPWRAETRLSTGAAAASEEAKRYIPHFV